MREIYNFRKIIHIIFNILTLLYIKAILMAFKFRSLYFIINIRSLFGCFWGEEGDLTFRNFTVKNK